ncbi:MAG: type II toxin-antitoxin system RelE/ParE family toxin [Nanoarchaeota archaeon]
MYELKYSQLFSKQLRKLSKEIQERVVTSLERCRIRPHDHVKKLVGVPYFSLRVGDYRLIMNIDEGNLRIFVIEIGHRKNIYE